MPDKVTRPETKAQAAAQIKAQAEYERQLIALSPTEREAKLLLSATDVIDAERKHIRAGRPDLEGGKGSEGVEWWGIGLSGGGIRSASLALGVLQSLAEHDLLRRFQYISSVSGGGYIASSLQWWWSQGRTPDLPVDKVPSCDDRGAYGTRPYNFPYGPAHPTTGAVEAVSPDKKSSDPKPDPTGATTEAPSPAPKSPDPKPELVLSFLRAHSSYLTPGHGLTVWSMIGVLLRTIIISVATWLPLLTLVMGLLFLVDLAVELVAAKILLYPPLGKAMPVIWEDYFEQVLPQLDVYRYRVIFAVPLYLSYLSVAAFVFAAILFALVSHAPADAPGPRSKKWPAFWILAVLGLFSVTMVDTFRAMDASIIFLLALAIVAAAVVAVTLVADYATDTNLNKSYWLRRKLETTIGKLFPFTIICFVLGTIPLAPYVIAKNLAAGSGSTGSTITGVFSVVAGVASALYGYYTFLFKIIPGLVGQIAATIGAVIYLYATVVFAYVLVLILVHPQSFVDGDGIALALRIGISLSILLACWIAVWGNINYVGLHRFYRDRLMEAFMPTGASVREMATTTTPLADSLSMEELDRLSLSGLPYPLINANAILINDLHQKYASRGGDNFIISPLYVGSTATGWRSTPQYIKVNGPLTLPSAMAASGAAATASAGYIGTGITRNPLVSAVMSLLNIRLGLWIGNPFFATPGKLRRIPTFLNPGLVSGVFQQAHTFDSKYLELTDGGHFENLALYELVRRRTKVILIVDGEADPKISLASLVSATRRIEEDFGASLEFETGMGPAQLVMYPGKDRRNYPADTRYAAAPFALGKLTYNHPVEKDGLLIYVKSTVIEQMDFKTAGYLASNPEFPHQSTVDQFFDPAQFDAYRCLGYESIETALSALMDSKSLDAYPALKNVLMSPEAKIASLTVTLKPPRAPTTLHPGS
ncbi:MAG TPA: patatin-like phospholipase family protein [Bradyrhizobium sp.]|nr:patatin-like phospholipase family protein [Bradyrhizobium sp.]